MSSAKLTPAPITDANIAGFKLIPPTMIEKTFANNELDIELTSFIDKKQNIWFKKKRLLRF